MDLCGVIGKNIVYNVLRIADVANLEAQMFNLK
jgi:hypothetical protein